MAKETLEKPKIDEILKELKLIKGQLRDFLSLIPEESLDEYENKDEIKEAYQRAIKEYPPKQ